MLKALVIAGVALMLTGPAFAGNTATTTTQNAASQSQPKAKPKPQSLEDGRTLADYNIQKE